jgi:hypothetical protein
MPPMTGRSCWPIAWTADGRVAPVGISAESEGTARRYRAAAGVSPDADELLVGPVPGDRREYQKTAAGRPFPGRQRVHELYPATTLAA